jgi:peptidoglycan/LPS O-acetylase OafA/YrhL
MIRTLYGHVGAWATLGITTALLLVLAWLVHRFVERPSQRWLRAALEKESRKRAAADPA